MNERLQEVLMLRMIPPPESIHFRNGICIIDDGVRVEVSAGGDDIEAKIAARFKQFWGVIPSVRRLDHSATAAFAGEEYRVEVSPERISLAARDLVGVEQALKTLRQLAEAGRGTATIQNYVLQACDIHDAPRLNFRGIHLCVFPETPMWFIDKQIRLAAYHKFNYVVIESWGVFPFQSHPEFGWADRKRGGAEFEHLLQVARECGVTLIPQLNLFGHATMSRVNSARHAVLDAHPELAPLFEPAGWSFCLSNPETRQMLAELVVELHDFMAIPNISTSGVMRLMTL